MDFLEMISLMLSGNHNDFNMVLESENGVLESDEPKLKVGDLILRPMDGKGLFYHAGIYCGESEVIDFVGKTRSYISSYTGYLKIFTSLYLIILPIKCYSIHIFIYIYLFVLGQPDTSQEKNEGSTFSSLTCVSPCVSPCGSFVSSFMDGKVSKVGMKTFLRNKMCRVLRLKSGIAEGFRQRVKNAMNKTLKYDAMTFNCLHFALELLG